MKNTLIAVILLTSIVAIAGDQTRIYVEDAPKDSWVSSGQNERSVRSFTKLAKNEVKFGGTDADPIRKPYNFRVTEEVITEHVTNEIPYSVTNIVNVEWIYCKLDAGDIVYFGQHDFEDTVGMKTYNSSADTLDIIIGTGAVTAGRMILVVGIINVANLLANG